MSTNNIMLKGFTSTLAAGRHPVETKANHNNSRTDTMTACCFDRRAHSTKTYRRPNAYIYFMYTHTRVIVVCIFVFTPTFLLLPCTVILFLVL